MSSIYHDTTRKSEYFEHDDLGKSIAADYLRRSRHILSSINGSKALSFDENGLVEPIEFSEMTSNGRNMTLAPRGPESQKQGIRTNGRTLKKDDSKARIQTSPMRRSPELLEGRGNYVVSESTVHVVRRNTNSPIKPANHLEEQSSISNQTSEHSTDTYFVSPRLSLNSFLSTGVSGDSRKRPDLSSDRAGATTKTDAQGEHRPLSDDLFPANLPPSSSTAQDVGKFYSQLKNMSDKRIVAFRARLREALSPALAKRDERLLVGRSLSIPSQRSPSAAHHLSVSHGNS